MATITITLPADLARFVDNEVSTGGYASSSEVVREALRLLQRHKAPGQEERAILRREVALGMEDAVTGRFSGKSVIDIANEVRRQRFGG